MADEKTIRVAAIDVGTNTTRLLVAEGAGKRYRDLDRRLAFTRLGAGVDETHLISPDAQERTLKAIAEYCAISGELGVERLRIAGTSAVRDATNRQEFLSQASDLSGIEAEVLDGTHEAYLSFLGATRDLEYGSYLVCDIGGGSTEFVLGKPGGKIEGRVSLDIGSVRLTERYLLSDPPATEEILTMESAIDDALVFGAKSLPGAEQARLVGVAGTVTTLAAIHLGLEEYDPEATHLAHLQRRAVNGLYQDLARMGVESRKRLPSLPPERADIIVAGASVLARTMSRWSFNDLIVSEKDILDGLILELLEEGT